VFLPATKICCSIHFFRIRENFRINPLFVLPSLEPSRTSLSSSYPEAPCDLLPLSPCAPSLLTFILIARLMTAWWGLQAPAYPSALFCRKIPTEGGDELYRLSIVFARP
jgi:hypothetical protein